VATIDEAEPPLELAEAHRRYVRGVVCEECRELLAEWDMYVRARRRRGTAAVTFIAGPLNGVQPAHAWPRNQPVLQPKEVDIAVGHQVIHDPLRRWPRRKNKPERRRIHAMKITVFV
jgi:hypothetical protein